MDGDAIREFSSLPQPPGLPWLGNALKLGPERMHLQLEEWAREFGRFYRVQVPGQQMLVVTDNDLARRALKDRPDTFRRIRTIRPIAEELHLEGVFSEEGAAWKTQRQVWLASLNVQQLKTFHDQLLEITRRLLRRWQAAADRGDAVDVAQDLMRYTVDVTMRFAFGHEANTLEQGEDVIQRHLDKIFPMLGRRVRGGIPYWRYFKLPRDREVDRAIVALEAEVKPLIERARQRLAADPQAEPRCFLEAMLVANARDGTQLSDRLVMGNALTALLAGEDTTANSMAWLMHCVADRPDIYAALRAEADAMLDAEDAPDREVPRADRFPHYLRMTDAAINETMRLYPVAPIIFLEANRDTLVGDVAVPAGTAVLLLLRAAAGSAPSSDPPPHFDPEADAQRADAGPGRAATLPFGFGPRLCPGRNLALAELRSATLMLARNFDIERAGGAAPVFEELSFTLVPRNLRIRFRRRQTGRAA